MGAPELLMLESDGVCSREREKTGERERGRESVCEGECVRTQTTQTDRQQECTC